MPDGYIPAGSRARGLQRMREVLEQLCARNPDIGYWQGFTDLAAPLLHVFHDNAMAAACLHELVAVRMRSSFLAASGLQGVLDELDQVGGVKLEGAKC
ncbi:TBC domain-containing protein kinase-like protein [Haematococcus lacustris]|uniref:TBC domain-containing protein kinase-like protein n=1 Tax=Haematococcus lacustris TaxID=44745 RepID=A0A6A0A6T3_HAELA|nr:TBC domain-containing protein kinase-like protein [Haematococcus lacustris]